MIKLLEVLQKRQFNEIYLNIFILFCSVLLKIFSISLNENLCQNKFVSWCILKVLEIPRNRVLEARKLKAKKTAFQQQLMLADK